MTERCERCGGFDEHLPWCRARRRYAVRIVQQTRTTPVRIFEDVQRSWEPEEKATDEAMNAVLEILIRRGRSYQHDIADELAAVMDVKIGTARAYVSASLLFFRRAGWVRLIEGGRPAVWELDE